MLRILALTAVSLACTHGETFAQAVQLPTFSFFTVQTTVSVPDSGAAYLGGVRRSSTGATAFGPSWGARSAGVGRTQAAAGASVSAAIHDFEAADNALLAGRAPGAPAAGASSAPLVLGKSLPATGGAGISVDAARQLHERELAAQQSDAAALYEKGRRAEADRKTSVARLYYEMAARRATGELRAAILARHSALSAPATARGIPK